MRAFLLLLGVCLWLGGIESARAQKFADSNLEGRMAGQTKRLGKNKINNGKLGSGEVEKFENSYTADLKNPSLSDAISGLSLRIITFYMPYDFDGRDNGQEPNKIQVRDKIDLQPGEAKRITFDPEKFEKGSAVQTTSTTITTTHIGVEYAGVVLEVYQNGKLLGVRCDGNGAARKAYDAWVKKKGLLQVSAEKPKESPAASPSDTPTVITPTTGAAVDPFVPK